MFKIKKLRQLGPENSNPNETRWNLIVLVLGIGLIFVLATILSLKYEVF